MSTLRVAAIGDLHMHESTPGLYRELFARVSGEADVVVLCGDMTNVGLPKEAELLAEDLHVCRVPLLAVLGNHDYESGKADEVKRILTAAKVLFLEDQTFKLKHVGFAGVKGFAGGFDTHMLASFGEEAIKRFVAEGVSEALKLETQLASLEARYKIVVLHYAPIAQTLHGEPPEVHPFLGCSRLAETIDRYGAAAVFHGHAHHGALSGKTAKGAPVYNCCIEALKRKHAPNLYTLVEV